MVFAAPEGDFRRFDLRLGLFRSDHDTILRVDGKTLGTEIDFEDVLGLDESLTRVVRGGFSWRFAQRHQFSTEYYAFRRSGKVISDVNFKVEDVQVLAGASVDTRLNIDVLDMNYGYFLVDTPRHELLGTVGLFWMKLSTKLTANGNGKVIVDGEPITGDASYTTDADGVAPLPTLGADYRWQFADNWRLGAWVSWFGVEVGDYKGRLLNGSISVDYQTPWFFNVGLAYSAFDMNVSARSEDLKGKIEWRFNGPQLYLGASF